MKHMSLFLLLAAVSYNSLWCMKQEESSDKYIKWKTYYKSENDPFITDACFIPAGYEIAIATRNGGIHIFRPFLSLHKEEPLKDSHHKTLLVDTKEISGRYLKNIMYSKGYLYVLTNSSFMTDKELETFKNQPKSQYIQSVGVMQNQPLPYEWQTLTGGFFREETMLFCDAQSGFMAVQKNDKSSIRLTNICYKDSNLKTTDSFIDSKEETITSAAYNEKKRLCVFAITNDSFQKMVNKNNKFVQCQMFQNGNERIRYPHADKYIKLVSCTDFLERWKQPMQAAECAFNEEGTRVAFYAPEQNKIYVCDTSHGDIVYVSPVTFRNPYSLSFNQDVTHLNMSVDWSDSPNNNTLDNESLRLVHYNDDRSQKMVVTPETVTIYKTNENK